MKLSDFSQNHQCAPRDWRKTKNMTGDYVFDAGIERLPESSEIRNRLENHIAGGKSYGIRSGYSGYHGYSSDD